MARCEVCGKGPMAGHNVSHSMVKTKRRWAANIQKVIVVRGGVTRHMFLCTKCMKTLNKTS